MSPEPRASDLAVKPARDPLAALRVILVDTSHPGNIGSTARAMKTMGLSRLYLVNPRYQNPQTAPEALALATGADDILAATTVCATLDEALAGTRYALALSARQRDLAPRVLALEDAAKACIDRAHLGDEVALVFGGERYGLDNQDVMRCQAITSIPTSRHYSSLNLSQAVQLVAYECQRAASRSASPAQALNAEPLASAEDRERLFVHLEEVLVAIDFIKPGEPRRVMQRLRRLFSRTALESEEVAILRGICTQILTRRKP